MNPQLCAIGFRDWIYCVENALGFEALVDSCNALIFRPYGPISLACHNPRPKNVRFPANKTTAKRTNLYAAASPAAPTALVRRRSSWRGACMQPGHVKCGLHSAPVSHKPVNPPHVVFQLTRIFYADKSPSCCHDYAVHLFRRLHPPSRGSRRALRGRGCGGAVLRRQRRANGRVGAISGLRG